MVACATCAHCGDIASSDFAIQDALCVSWRENLNWREINKALYLENGCKPMDLSELGLDADQLRALHDGVLPCGESVPKPPHSIKGEAAPKPPHLMKGEVLPKAPHC